MHSARYVGGRFKERYGDIKLADYTVGLRSLCARCARACERFDIAAERCAVYNACIEREWIESNCVGLVCVCATAITRERAANEAKMKDLLVRWLTLYTRQFLISAFNLAARRVVRCFIPILIRRLCGRKKNEPYFDPEA